MAAAAPRVILLTSERSRVLPAPGIGVPFVVDRQPWTTAQGELDADEVVQQVISSDPSVLCVASDVPDELVFEVCRRIDELHPDIGVLLLREPDVRLWREAARTGVRDVIAPAAEAADLLPAIRAAIDRAERIRAARTAADMAVPRGKVIVVLSPKGGSGKTMVASNVAAALASSNTGDAVLIDLDCVFGDVASVLGLVPEQTVGQLAMLSSFDSTTLKVFLTRHDESGLYVLAGPGSPEEGDAVTEKLASQVVEMLSREFAYVIVDTAAGLDERALAVIEQATDVVLLASMDVMSVRNLAKEMRALDRLHLAGARRHFILNRADARVGLEIPDVEAVIGMTADAALPSSRLVPLSMNRGKVIVVEEPDSPVARQLSAFAARFIPPAQRALDGGEPRKSRFSLRRH